MGKWKVEYVGINGNDATQLYFDSCGCDFYFNVDKHELKYLYMMNCNNYYSNFCNCNFDDERILKIYVKSRVHRDSGCWSKPYPIFGPFKVMDSCNWGINKLSNKKLWIENNYNDNNYIIKMEKYEKDN